jgi:hypothetical protein
VKNFFGLYWKIDKSKNELWFNFDKSGCKINHVIAFQVAQEADIKVFIFILGKHMLKVAKVKISEKPFGEK